MSRVKGQNIGIFFAFFAQKHIFIDLVFFLCYTTLDSTRNPSKGKPI